MRKQWTACILAACMVMSAGTVYAGDEFEGWNEDARQNAWDVMEATEWDKLQDALILDRYVTNIGADVSESVRAYEEDIRRVMASNSEVLTISDAQVELMLAMLQVMGGEHPSGNDPYQTKEWFGTRDLSKEQTISYVYDRLNHAYEAHPGTPNYYKNDDTLRSVIQGVMLTASYTRENPEYSLENSTRYYGEHLSVFESKPRAPMLDFADRVSELYHASSVGGGSYNGTVTPSMETIVDVARNNAGNFPCTPDYCAAWVTGVYQAAGAPTIPWGNAIDMWNDYQATGSSDMSNIPPGAIVCGSGSGPMGAIYGHVGIYLGDATVANNIGSFSIEPLDSWISWQTATCQGHTGWIGWVYPGGVPAD